MLLNYLKNSWLEDFAYRISIPWWAFILAGVIAVLIALFTISFQAIKAAISKPCKKFKNRIILFGLNLK